MEWMNFRHLYAFWAVCRYGGFGKAADKIHVSQSTVSEQVAELEAYLDEELLERHTRAVRVTDRGAALLGFADEIFARSSTINAIFRDKQEAIIASNIRVGLVGGISRNFIYGLIEEALARDTQAHIDVVDGSFDELIELLRAFELDLIFSLDRPRQKDLMTVSHQRVESSPLCLAGTPELIRRIRRKRAAPLHTELYLFRQPVEGSPLDERVARRFHLEVSVPVSTDDISLLRFLANSGRGLSVVPAIGVKEDVAAGHVATLPLKRAPSVDMFAIYLTQGVRRRLVEAFLN
jgi:LysR family transcriptional activator of nhaA